MKRAAKTRPAALRICTTCDQVATLICQPLDFLASVAEKPESHYTEFSIPKPDGELRTIRPPRKVLRSVQRRLLGEFYRRVCLPKYLHGGLPRRSIFTHAKAHVGRMMVATLDVRKFFPSTTREHVRPVIEAIGFRDQALEVVLALTVFRNSLAQGAPTSCLLANLAFSQADSAFMRLCRRWELRYGRYVDDIAVSGDLDIRALRGPFIDFIKSANYDVAGDDKIKFMPACERQVVTGLVVNEKLRPTAEFIREVTHVIRLCQTLGAAAIACSEGLSVKRLKSRLTGRVSHIGQADRQLGRRLRGLLHSVNWSHHFDERTRAF